MRTYMDHETLFDARQKCPGPATGSLRAVLAPAVYLDRFGMEVGVTTFQCNGTAVTQCSPPE